MQEQNIRRAQFEIKKKIAAQDAMQGGMLSGAPRGSQSRIAKPDIPKHVLHKWQRFLDLLTGLAGVTEAMIVRSRPDEDEIVAANTGNSFKPGRKITARAAPWYEAFIKQRMQRFHSYVYSPDAAHGAWYIGYPLNWGDGEPFGMLCLVGGRRSGGAENSRALLAECAGMIDDQLRLLVYMQQSELIRERLRQSLAETEAIAMMDSMGSKPELGEIDQMMRRLDFLAHHDNLTGLPNRLLFTARLRHAIQRARRERSKAAVYIIDLDSFKQINDSYGHVAGDELLRQVAARLTGALREEDTVARLGGDEFAVIMEAVDGTPEAEQLSGKVRDCFSKPFALEGRAVKLSASIGISLFPDDGEDFDALVRHADHLMYRSRGGLLPT
ncbi:MAG: GGDEF domain-containing protein [Pseudomonadota bacterium]